MGGQLRSPRGHGRSVRGQLGKVKVLRLHSSLVVGNLSEKELRHCGNQLTSGGRDLVLTSDPDYPVIAHSPA